MTRNRRIGLGSLALFLILGGLLLALEISLRRGRPADHVWSVGVPIRAVAFGPDGTTVVAGGDDGAVRLGDRHADQPLRTLQGVAIPVSALAFSPDGTTLAVGHAGDGPRGAAAVSSVEVWRVADGVLLRQLELPDTGVRSVAFDPGGQMLAAGGETGRLVLWHADDWQPVVTIAQSTRAILQLVFDATSAAVIAGTADDRVWRWNWADGRLLSVREDTRGADTSGRQVRSLALSHDGRYVATSAFSFSPWVYTWYQHDGSFMTGLESVVSLRHRSVGCDGGARDSLAISPDSRLVAGGMGKPTVSDDNLAFIDTLNWPICLWDAESGREVAKYTGHEGAIGSVAWDPAGTVLVSGSDDGTVRIWQLP